MPGQVLRKAVHEWLTEQGGREFIWDHLRSGETLTSIGKSIVPQALVDEVLARPNTRTGKVREVKRRHAGVSRAMIWNYLRRGGELDHDINKGDHEETLQEYARIVRDEAADGTAESSLEINRDALGEKDAAKIKALDNFANSKRWFAARQNPDKYGTQVGKVDIKINFGNEIHLPSMRELGAPIPKQLADTEQAEYEIVRDTVNEAADE